MARLERKNVDYFPHPCTNGDKMKYLRSKFGNNGYATWYVILEKLGRSEFHYIDLSQEMSLMFLADECLVDENTLTEIIEILVKFGEFDSEIWNDYKTIYCDKFIGNIADAWKNRKTDIPDKNLILTLLSQKYGKKSELLTAKVQKEGNQFTKETKGNKSKENDKKGNAPNGFSPPLLDEVIQYFSEKGFSAEIAKKAFEYYHVSDWKDSKGNKVKNWKQKMLAVWMKEENKTNQQNQNYGIKPTIAERARASREQAARELANPIVIDPTTDFFSLPKARTDESGKP